MIIIIVRLSLWDRNSNYSSILNAQKLD